MSEPFLIAHVVRGEPAFDIAIQMEVEGQDDSPWWIIPTSGHRAYPYWEIPLRELRFCEDHDSVQIWPTVELLLAPPDWPDHYQTAAAKGEGQIAASDLLKALGLGKAAEPFTRRI